MCFCSTLISEDYGIQIPQWFKEKYESYFNCDKMPISSKVEIKEYSSAGEVLEDFKKVLIEDNKWNDEMKVVFIWLHECGGLTRAEVSRSGVKYSEPVEWEKTDGVTHSYCYGCDNWDDIKTN